MPGAAMNWGTTMADKTQPKDDGLDLQAFFDAAQGQGPEASPDLLARVLADAEDQRAAPVAPARRPRLPRLRALAAALGGWPAFAGLATAAVTGVWIGFSAPDTVDDLTAGYLGIAETPQFADLMPQFDMFMTEG